jgi:hypothetical protein
MAKTKKQARLHRKAKKPGNERLPWPGLRAKDRLSRLVTRAVKEAMEMKDNETWAESQIARVLDYVSPATAMRLIFRETRRRRRPLPQYAKALLKLLPIWSLRQGGPRIAIKNKSISHL